MLPRHGDYEGWVDHLVNTRSLKDLKLMVRCLQSVVSRPTDFTDVRDERPVDYNGFPESDWSEVLLLAQLLKEEQLANALDALDE